MIDAVLSKIICTYLIYVKKSGDIKHLMFNTKYLEHFLTPNGIQINSF